jgi:hypothetical protein
MKITVGHLYPGLMSTFGDRGNVETIVRRCRWRNIAVAVTELRQGDKVVPGEVDIIMIGGGSASQQRLIADDLYKVKGSGIRDAVAAGAAALAVGGGFELCGRFCQPEKGAELRGIELFDSWTIRQSTARPGTISRGASPQGESPHGASPQGSVPDDHDDAAPEASAERFIGDLVVRWDGGLLVGVENHSGATYLGPAAQPLGQVLAGHGNNGDGSEGVVLGGAVGTNLGGPCLPTNPALADFLVGAALRQRYGTAELTPLADDLELAARDAAVQRTTRPAARSHRSTGTL